MLVLRIHFAPPLSVGSRLRLSPRKCRTLQNSGFVRYCVAPASSCVRIRFSYFALHHFSLFNWFVISFNSLLMSSSNDPITSSAQNSTAPPAVIKISIVIVLLVLKIRFARRLSCAVPRLLSLRKCARARRAPGFLFFFVP